MVGVQVLLAFETSPWALENSNGQFLLFSHFIAKMLILINNANSGAVFFELLIAGFNSPHNAKQ